MQPADSGWRGRGPGAQGLVGINQSVLLVRTGARTAWCPLLCATRCRMEQGEVCTALGTGAGRNPREERATKSRAFLAQV